MDGKIMQCRIPARLENTGVTRNDCRTFHLHGFRGGSVVQQWIPAANRPPGKTLNTQFLQNTVSRTTSGQEQRIMFYAAFRQLKRNIPRSFPRRSQTENL